MTANPLPPDDDTPQEDPLGIDPELIEELDKKSKEIVAEAVADGTIGVLLNPEQIFPSPGNPMGVARRLLKDWTHNGLTTLLHWRGSWMQWQFTHWVEIEEGTIRGKVYARLEEAVYLVSLKGDKKADEPKTLLDMAAPWLPNRRKVGDVMEAMKGCVHLTELIDTPSWVRGAHGKPANELVACTNGLLHIGTRELFNLTPAYFNRVSVPFNYDPDAPEPTRWLEFLHQLWPDDDECIAAVQDWFGYVISGRTDLQKILLMIGPIRSGKGTIARVLEALLGGRGNVAGSTMASLATNFGLEPLVGKPLCVISDARMSTQNAPQALERLLSISGEDLMTIDRKYKPKWTGALPTRFFLISNELPRFLDPSGAIASRFVVVETIKSFLGHEDRGLTAALLTELPGILNWSLVGLDRITRGPFTTPQSSEAAIVALQDLISPVSAFVRDMCERGPHQSAKVSDLFDGWRRWCETNGHPPGSLQTFGRDLRTVVRIQSFQPHGQGRWYRGIGLKTWP
jgi:putative DNA primase/helicase